MPPATERPDDGFATSDDGERDAVPSTPATPSTAAAATSPPSGGRSGGVSSIRTFESLADAGYRWYLLSMLGQMASLNMQQLVRGFLVFELTGSYTALGTLFLFNSIPGLLFSLAGGVVADRVQHKRRVVQIGQLLNGGNALVLALLIYFDVLRFEHILIAALAHSTVMSLMMPARQAMLPEVVGLDRLTNAVALNAAGMNAMRLLAPSAAGFLIAALGPHWVYFIITGLYLYASGLLMLVPTENAMLQDGDEPQQPEPERRSGYRELIDGFRYIAHDPVLRPLLAAAVLFAVFSMPYLFLLPGFVAAVLGEGPGQLGLLMTFTGVGSLTGSVFVASLPPHRRGRLFLFSGVMLGVTLVAFSASTWFWATAGILLFVGIADAGRQSLSMVLVQAYVQDEFRGRVMSVYMMQRSVATFATFFVGLAASIFGAQIAIGGIAVALVIASLLLLAATSKLRDLD